MTAGHLDTLFVYINDKLHIDSDTIAVISITKLSAVTVFT